MPARPKRSTNHALVKKALNITRTKQMIKKVRYIQRDELDTEPVSPTGDPEELALPAAVRERAEKAVDCVIIYHVHSHRRKINGHLLAKQAAQPGLLEKAATILKKVEAQRDAQEEAKAVNNLFGDLDLTGVNSIGSIMGKLST